MASPIISMPVARPRLPMGVRSLGSVVHGSTSKSLPIYMNLAGSEVAPSDTNPSLRMLIFGKPCTGKGTLASKLTAKYDIHSLSTGDLLRRHIIERSATDPFMDVEIRIDDRTLIRTPIGKEVEEIVAKGGLLPDELMLDLVTQTLDKLRSTVRQIGA